MWAICFGVEMLFWSGLGSVKPIAHLLDRQSPVTDAIATVLSAPWLGPTTEPWAVPMAYLALLLPSFLLSGWVEALLIGGYDWLDCEGDVKTTVWRANMLSYSFLALAGTLGLRLAIKHL